MDPEIRRLFEFITWVEDWRVALNKFDDELVVSNLKRLHDELDEAGKDGGGTFDLDLLFVDVLSACGLGELQQLERVVGKAGVVRALKMGCLPKVRDHG